MLRENNQAANKTWVWTYDNAGNILSRSEYAYTTAESPANPIDTVVYSYADSDWGDLLTAYDGQAITYDTIGNPLSDGTWNYTWQHGRELAAMSNGSTTWTYAYNADGLRTSRTNGTTAYSYVYNGSTLSQMTIGGNTLVFSYDANGFPLSVAYNGTTYYYVTNVQGDVIGILDSAGATVVTYTYDAWGNHLSTTGSLSSTLGTHNPLRYRGYVYDNETRLYYLQSRYYNPEIGRFLNADAFASTGQGVLGGNMFAYCCNSVVACYDPSGTKRDLCWAQKLDGGGAQYIYNQNHEPYASLWLSSMIQLHHGGCGPVATYNAMQLLGQYTTSIHDVVSWYQDNHALYLGGMLGSLPWATVDYFREQGYTVVVSDVISNCDSYGRPADACIMWYVYQGNNHLIYAHFVAFSQNENVGTYYNVWSNQSGVYATSDQLPDILGDRWIDGIVILIYEE